MYCSIEYLYVAIFCIIKFYYNYLHNTPALTYSLPNPFTLRISPSCIYKNMRNTWSYNFILLVLIQIYKMKESSKLVQILRVEFSWFKKMILSAISGFWMTDFCYLGHSKENSECFYLLFLSFAFIPHLLHPFFNWYPSTTFVSLTNSLCSE
jgi:hypothetical protein